MCDKLLGFGGIVIALEVLQLLRPSIHVNKSAMGICLAVQQRVIRQAQQEACHKSN